MAPIFQITEGFAANLGGAPVQSIACNNWQGVENLVGTKDTERYE